MPDIVLGFQQSAFRNVDPDMLSLHPSVRLNRWQRDKVLSFVPPDGTFTLCSYSLPLPSTAPLPVHIRPNLSLHKDRGKLEISVQPARSPTAPVENLVLVATLPASAEGVKVETSVGKAVWDVLGKVISTPWCRLFLLRETKRVMSISAFAGPSDGFPRKRWKRRGFPY